MEPDIQQKNAFSWDGGYFVKEQQEIERKLSVTSFAQYYGNLTTH